MNIKISVKSIDSGILLILLYHIVFVKFSYLSFYVMIQRVMVMILFLMILPKIRFRKRDTIIIALLGMYAVFTLISSFAGKDDYVYTRPLVGGFFHVVIIFEIFEIFLYVLKVNGAEFLIKIFFFLSLIYAVDNDFLVIFYPRMFRYEYFVGNKFTVSYKHIEFIVLYCMTNRKNIAVLSGIFLLSFYISIKVNCMTGAVGIGLLAVLLFLKARNLLYNRFIFGSTMAVSMIFPFVYDYIMGISPIQYFIVNILHRTAGLTGRTAIFDYLPMILKGHWLLGYGYNTAYEVWITSTVWYPNAQNGFWNCVCEQGIVSAVLLTVMAVYVTGLSGKNTKLCYPLVCVIYVYALLGAVEITMDITFTAWIILLYMLKRGDSHAIHQCHCTRLQR